MEPSCYKNTFLKARIKSKNKAEAISTKPHYTTYYTIPIPKTKIHCHFRKQCLNAMKHILII